MTNELHRAQMLVFGDELRQTTADLKDGLATGRIQLSNEQCDRILSELAAMGRILDRHRAMMTGYRRTRPTPKPGRGRWRNERRSY